jgi:hypothetical protein
MNIVRKLSDTATEADHVLTQIYRRMPLGKKWLLLGEDYRCAKILHAAGIRQRNPSATPADIEREWRAAHLGSTLVDITASSGMDQGFENLQVVREVAAVFERLAIPYALGGSMASSVYGISRFTRDADLVAEPFPGREAEFAASFGPDYYLSMPAIQEALRDRSSFNIIHTRSGFKIDVFVRKDRPYELSAMQRRLSVVLPDVPERPMSFVTAEDVILFKMERYRLGDEALDQQWQDILGVLKIQRGRLDDAYLEHWAAELRLSDLLTKARQEVQY